ncbi:MAG: hypothetical protein LIP28_00435, partial [Deltaproteobacteria bacterium]|nr:hypothetical protein [Deltaproteobacteria bacterium]
MASITRYGHDRLVISLEGDIRQLAVSPGSVAELVLAFPMDGVTVRVEDRDIILECPNGDVIRLVGARGEVGVTYAVEGVDAFPSLDAFLARFAPQSEDRRSGLTEDDAKPFWEENHGGSQRPGGSAGSDDDPAGKPDEREHEGFSQAEYPESGSVGHSVDGLPPGSGLNQYQTGHETLDDRAGKLIASIDRYDDLGSGWWNEDSSTALRPESPPFQVGGGSVPPVLPPTIACAHQPGPAYLASSTVMEGDAYGMHLELRLSEAPETPLNVTLVVGGNAVMDDGAVSEPDYAHWTDWELVLPDGTVIPATDCMTETSPGHYQLALPAGTTQAYIRIPLENNDLSQGDRNFTYSLQNTGRYQPEGGMGGTIVIVDENRCQDFKPWDPAAPATLPPGVTGPIAQVTVNDGGNWEHANSVAENDANPVTYRFELLTQGGVQHTVGQPDGVNVVLRLSGRNGLLFCDSTGTPGADNDLVLADIVNAFRAGGATDVRYDDATGELSFTLPQGWSGHIDFTAGTQPDNRLEPGVGGESESLRIEVVSVFGDEALRGQGTVSDILDIPSVSVVVSDADIFESDQAALPNETTFTFSLTSPATVDFDLQLDWGHSSGMTAGDYVYSLDGGKNWSTPGTALPSSVHVNKGDESLAIMVRAVDDARSEGAETVTVMVKPQHGATDGAADDYHVATAPGTGASPSLSDTAAATIHDDTSAVYGDNGAHLDGPTVIVAPVNPVTGQPATDPGGEYATSNGFTENADEVEYVILLVGPDGKTAYAGERETITVTIDIKALGGSGIFLEDGGTYPSDPGGRDFCFYDLASLPGYVRNADGTISFTVDAGTTSVTIKGKIYPDTVGETGEGVKITITDVSGNEAQAGPAVTTEFYDLPVVSIEAVADNVSESDTSGMGFTVHLSAPSSQPITVLVQLGDAGDTADFGLDYDRSGLTPHPTILNAVWVTIPAGETSHTFRVPIKDDALTEGNETVSAVILPPDGVSATDSDEYRLSASSADNKATVTLVDDTRAWPANGTGAEIA